MNMTVKGLNSISRYFTNNGFCKGVPYSNSSIKEAPLQGVRSGVGKSRH